MLDASLGQLLEVARENALVSLAVVIVSVTVVDDRYDLGVRDIARAHQRWLVAALVGFVGGVLIGRAGGVDYLLGFVPRPDVGLALSTLSLIY